MLSEQEKSLLAQAEYRVQQNTRGGLENYLRPEVRDQIKDHPSRTAWCIHFHAELTQRQEGVPTLQTDLLDQAFRMADAVVAYDVIGQQAFDNDKYLRDRKMGMEFCQLLQRCRLRVTDPSIKTILLKMAHEVMAA